MLRIGIVGFGFMGRMHFRCWNDRDDSEVVAVCDANPDLEADTKKAIGNLDGAEEDIDFSGFALYTDLDAMLAAEKLDAVSITLPTPLHPAFTAKAFEAGVHVLCEKPMALNLPDCEAMMAAAERAGKHLLVGHCIRFWPEYAHARRAVISGEYGDVIAASFRRLSGAPGWSHDDWLKNEAASGGVALDLHIHDTDFIQYVFGPPRSVTSKGGRAPGGAIGHISTTYDIEDGPLVTAEGSWVMAPSFGFEMSFHIVLEKATLVFDCTRDPAYRVCPAEGEAFTPDLPGGDGYVHQIDHFARLSKGENPPAVITPAQSRDAVRIVEAERESMLTGRPVAL